MLDTEGGPTLEIIAGGSAVPDSPATVVVPCTCPQEHEHDTVYLAPRLTVPMSIAMATALEAATPTVIAVEASLMEVYLYPAPVGGIERWTKLDAEGEPEPITRESIARLLPWGAGGLEVAEAASGLYAETYFAPLLKRRASSLQGTPTPLSTSQNPSSGKPRPKRSKRSSRNGSAGKP